MAEPSRPLVAALEADLFFAVRIADVVHASGGESLIVEDGPALWRAIERWPELVLVDLAVPGWEDPVRTAKTLPHTKAIPIVAFGSHVDTEMLQAARRAGCDHAWARSRLMGELPQLVDRAFHPETRRVAGWDEPPPALLLHGIEQFNAGEYWECHETLETLWRQETRPVRDLYQGILQVGVAFHHLRGGNYDGGIKMFRRGLPKLRGLPSPCQGVLVAALSAAARCIHDEAVTLGAERLSEMDLSVLPTIQVVAGDSAK
jgi:CheY-like chemotaxis protein